MELLMNVPVLVAANKEMPMTKVLVEDPRAGEVRVKMFASGVCHSCLHAYDGSHATPMPMILGDEGSGVVESVGSGVTTLVPGDHVIISWLLNCGTCPPCRDGKPAHCWAPSPFGALLDNTQRFKNAETGEPVLHYGPATYAPYTVVPESSAIKIRKDMPLDKAALIGCSVTTGFGAVTNAAGARPGESVAIVGCGGVGLNAVQGARVAGAYPIIAIDLYEGRLALAKEMGATHLINSSKVDPIAYLQNLGGADLSVDALGSKATAGASVLSLARRGRHLQLGLLITPDGLSEIPMARVIAWEIDLLGSHGMSARDYPEMLALVATGVLNPAVLVKREVGLAEGAKALAELDSNSLGGITIIKPNK
mgnify:CR=1 FL=1